MCIFVYNVCCVCVCSVCMCLFFVWVSIVCSCLRTVRCETVHVCVWVVLKDKYIIMVVKVLCSSRFHAAVCYVVSSRTASFERMLNGEPIIEMESSTVPHSNTKTKTTPTIKKKPNKTHKILKTKSIQDKNNKNNKNKTATNERKENDNESKLKDRKKKTVVSLLPFIILIVWFTTNIRDLIFFSPSVNQ